MRPSGIRPGVRRLLDVALRRPAQVRDDIDEEIGFHLEERVAQLIARGIAPEDARAEAERRFGNLAEARRMLQQSAAQREQRLRVREWLASWTQDLRVAVRSLRRSPAFVSIAVLCLALGIGANVAIFSVLDGVLLKPLPFARPQELVRVWSEGAVPPGIYDILAREQKSYTSLAGYELGREASMSGGSEPIRVQISSTTANLFETLGVQPLLGRTFRREDAEGGNERVIVLSYALWNDRFAADSAVVGRTVQVNAQARRVIGVMPSDFRFPGAAVAAWAPVQAAAGTPAYWWSTYLQLVGRLAAGHDAAGAANELNALLPRARQSFPMRMPDDWGRNASVVSLHESVTGSARPTLILMLGAVGLVLLIACVNVAMLYIGRASGRAREIAVRAALGGGRMRILRLLFTESLLVAVLGAGAGLALAWAALRVLVSMLPAGTPRVTDIEVDGRVLTFTMLLTVLSALFFGLLPAWRATRSDLAAALRATAGTSLGARGRKRAHASSLLAVLQLSLAVVLVSAAGLLIKSTWKLQHVPLGFATDGRYVATVPLPSFAADTAQRAPVFFASVLTDLRGRPGISAAAFASAMPFGDGITNAAMAVEAHPTAEGSVPPLPSLTVVSDGYFETLAIPLQQGRRFTAQDRAASQHVAIVDERAARTLWPNENAIGQRIRYVWNQDWFTVVGVVGTVARDSLNGPAQASLYLPISQSPPRDMRLVVASAAPAAEVARAVRAAIRAADATVPVPNARPLGDVVTGSAATSRFTTLVFSIFASVALLLGAIGIYGVISSGVLRRTREIGVRMAVGATTSQIARMVLGETLGVAAAGVCLGVAGTIAISGWIRGMLFGVDAIDPFVLALVAALLTAIAVIAALAPARRASRVDPLLAMRAD